MNLLGLDFETQGIDPKLVNITEIGAIRVDDHFVPLGSVSQLVWEPTYPPQLPEVVSVTGITDEMLKTKGMPPKLAFESLLFPLMEESDHIMAHNAEYDKTVLYAHSARLGMTPPEKPWLCTYMDVPYPAKYRCKQLSHLALDHGLLMDGRDLHRAIQDVRLMLELMQAHYSVPGIIALKAMPTVMLRAMTTAPWRDEGVSNGKAKALGYRWDAPNARWCKLVKENKVEEEVKAAKLVGLNVIPAPKEVN